MTRNSLVKNFDDGKVDKIFANLSNQYKNRLQNNILKQLFNLLKVKPELINQDILPTILSQNQNKKKSETVRDIKKEIKNRKLSARDEWLLKKADENKDKIIPLTSTFKSRRRSKAL